MRHSTAFAFAPRPPRHRSASAPWARVAALACALAVAAPAGVAVAEDDDVPTYPRIDPDNPGGERVGADDGEDGFTGYPADPGEPGDAYHDTSSEYQRYSPNYTGAYLAPGVLVGMGAVRGDLVRGVERTVAYGAFFNWSSINQIVDLQLQYLRAGYEPTTIEGTPATLTRQTVGANLLIHPLFLSIIGGRTGYVVANTYLLTGVGLELTDFDGMPDRRYASPGWRVGAGTGTFLDNPNDGGAFWLGIQFQRAYVQGAPNDPDVGRAKLRENILLLRLSYRFNGNVFAGFGGPRARTADSNL